jgi:hypothetical protein
VFFAGADGDYSPSTVGVAEGDFKLGHCRGLSLPCRGLPCCASSGGRVCKVELLASCLIRSRISESAPNGVSLFQEFRSVHISRMSYLQVAEDYGSSRDRSS